MNILITAGGTSERIDEVRKITNTATGRLGAYIAEELINKISTDITYLHGANAILPACDNIEFIKTASVSELKETVTKLFSEKMFGAVIHTMAVSDYSVKNVIPSPDMVSAITKAVLECKQKKDDFNNLYGVISNAILNESNYNGGRKLSSDFDNLLIVTEKTPKIINMFKQLQPDTVLVGFKLLVDTDNDALLDAGHGLLLRNNCDFVFANDLKNVNFDKHSGILIKPDRSYVNLYSKREIARVIAENVIHTIKIVK